MKLITCHLRCLQEKYQKYYKSGLNIEQFTLVLKPFHLEMGHFKHILLNGQESFAEFRNNTKLKIGFDKKKKKLIPFGLI